MIGEEVVVPITISVVGLPAGVNFRVQHKKGLLAPSTCSANSISFEFSVRVQRKNNELNFLGDYVNGIVGDRFIYVNSGTLAGDENSDYQRRAKIKLGSITETQIAEVERMPTKRLSASISGIAKDGGPACATVPILNKGWTII
ncbi:hypothetical protein BH10CYA1_BH10CYA1_04690 [soil metagenome]